MDAVTGDVCDAVPEPDAAEAEADADPEVWLEDDPVVVDDDVEDEDDDEDVVLEELEVEVTVESIVKRPEKLISVAPAEILMV